MVTHLLTVLGESLAARLAEMKARVHQERLAPARRVRSIKRNDSPVPIRRPRGGVELAAWLATQEKRKHEAYAFRDMGRKLDRQSREMRRERYVTAILGVKTSWPRILDHAKYAVCAEAA